MPEPSIEEQRAFVLKRSLALPRPPGSEWEARYREVVEAKDDDEIRVFYRFLTTGKKAGEP